MHTPLPAEIFKAYDIRGIVGKTLTADIVRRIGHGLGSLAVERGQRAIAVGRDGRLSGPELSAALMEGIRMAGIDSIDVGCVPTPVVYFAAHELGCQSCVAVTGSHNPPDYNGLKMVIGGETLAGETIQEIRQRVDAGWLKPRCWPGQQRRRPPCLPRAHHQRRPPGAADEDRHRLRQRCRRRHRPAALSRARL
jgi:phosphomannomutase/phosphoglucomutase